MISTSPMDTPNLRKRPPRASSKYSSLNKTSSASTSSTSLTSPPPSSITTSPSPSLSRTNSVLDNSLLTSSFILTSPSSLSSMMLNTPSISSSSSSSQSSFAAKRRALRFPEKTFPEKISFIPESKLFMSLLDFEKKLDLSLTRRQLDVQEAMRVRNTLKQVKTIRLTIYNTYAHQIGSYHLDTKSQSAITEPPSWTLRIEGRVDEPTNNWNRTKIPKKRFSSFVKKAFFQIGEDPNNTVEWDRAVASAETDGWEIKRAGDQEIEVKIIMFLEHSPSKVKLSPMLSALLNLHTDTRPRILMTLWQYIKARKLLDPNDRKTIINDENLKLVFGCDSMQFGDIPKHLRNHLSPPDPVELSHVIRLSGDPMEHAAIYDIQVEVDDTVAIQPSAKYKNEISNIEDQITQVVQQVHEHKRKRDFMLDFHNDPVVFLNKLVDNQIRDYKLMQAFPGRDPEEERKTSFYYQPYVEDAVQSYLSKRNNAQQPQVRVNLNLPPHLQPQQQPLSSTLSTPLSSTLSTPLQTPQTPQSTQPQTPQTPFTPGM